MFECVEATVLHIAQVRAMRVAGNKEGQGDKEDDGVDDKSGMQQRGQWQ